MIANMGTSGGAAPLVLVLLPLIGTIVGGGITVLGQYLGLSVQRRTAEQADVRAARRSAALDERSKIQEVLGLVAGDLAAIRAPWEPIQQDGSNAELLDATEIALRDLTSRHIAATGTIAQALDQRVYSGAEEVYDSWGRYFSEEINRLANETGTATDSEVTQRALAALDGLRSAAQHRLGELDSTIRQDAP